MEKRYNLSMSDQLPATIHQYFWGDNLDELSWQKHKKYIIQTLLDKGDVSALKWLFQQTNKQEITQMISSLKLSPKSNNFWQLYLS